MKPEEQPRDEIWFRKIYANLISTKQVRTIFRPGRRLCGDPKGFCKGEILTIKLLDKVGADWADLAGRVSDEVREKVEVLEVKCVPLGGLTNEDFNGSTPDVFDQQSLVYHLGVVYNLFPEELNEKTLVTKTTFRYLSQDYLT